MGIVMSEDELRRRLSKIDEDIVELKESNKALSQDLSETNKALTARLNKVETNDAVSQVHRTNVEKRLDAIENTLQKLAWLIISAIILAAMAWMIGGGLAVGGS